MQHPWKEAMLSSHILLFKDRSTVVMRKWADVGRTAEFVFWASAANEQLSRILQTDNQQLWLEVISTRNGKSKWTSSASHMKQGSWLSIESYIVRADLVSARLLIDLQPETREKRNGINVLKSTFQNLVQRKLRVHIQCWCFIIGDAAKNLSSPSGHLRALSVGAFLFKYTFEDKLL